MKKSSINIQSFLHIIINNCLINDMNVFHELEVLNFKLSTGPDGLS
jgi:hypothetical protein